LTNFGCDECIKSYADGCENILWRVGNVWTAGANGPGCLLKPQHKKIENRCKEHTMFKADYGLCDYWTRIGGGRFKWRNGVGRPTKPCKLRGVEVTSLGLIERLFEGNNKNKIKECCET
jgi:hypothetical protein